MTDQRDISERLRYPDQMANKARLMREAANVIDTLRADLESLGQTTPEVTNFTKNVFHLPKLE